MKMIAKLTLVALLAFPLASCESDMINVAALRPGLEKVLDRHDNYVKADQSLSDVLRKVYLQTTQLIRKILEEASK